MQMSTMRSSPSNLLRFHNAAGPNLTNGKTSGHHSVESGKSHVTFVAHGKRMVERVTLALFVIKTSMGSLRLTGA